VIVIYDSNSLDNSLVIYSLCGKLLKKIICDNYAKLKCIKWTPCGKFILMNVNDKVSLFNA